MAQKPVLKVVGWVGGNGHAVEEPRQPTARQRAEVVEMARANLKRIPTSDKPSVSTVYGKMTNDMMDDEVPF
jgi:hypothetical protein